MAKVLATKRQVLEFISERKLVQNWELAEKFGFSPKYVTHNLLPRLKKEKLIINMTRGFWELTEEGYRRLRYYTEKASRGGTGDP